MNVFVITVTNVAIKPKQKQVFNNIQNRSMKVFIITVTNVAINMQLNNMQNGSMKVFIITVNIVVIKEMQKDILNDMKITSINVTKKTQLIRSDYLLLTDKVTSLDLKKIRQVEPKSTFLTNVSQGPSVNTSSSYFFLSEKIALDPLPPPLYFPQVQPHV